MRIPIIVGTIERRLLVNFRVAPEVLARVVPPPFRPQVVAGWGVAGICLIRLSAIRPRWLPGPFGIRSENAAHRIAVEWDHGGERRVGVYIPRRDTSSRLNSCAGGRLFPGVHHHAEFTVAEGDGRYAVALRSEDGETRLSVSGRAADRLPEGSIFGSLAEASAFFSAARSATRRRGPPACMTASSCAPASGRSSRWRSTTSSLASSATPRASPRAASNSTTRC